MKPLPEILERLKELLRRHRKRYLKNHLKPKGFSCSHVTTDENGETYCAGCGTRDPEICLNHSKYHSIYTREQLEQMFRDDIRNTQRMLRDYRDVATLLWVTGAFDSPENYEASKEELISGVETHHNPDDPQ